MLRPQHFKSDQVYFNVNRTIEWELSFSGPEDSIECGYINYTRVYLTPPVLRTTQHRSTTYLSHPHYQWTLSLISSTSSQLPLMVRVCPRMKTEAAPVLPHRFASLHDFSFHIWRMIRLFITSLLVFFYTWIKPSCLCLGFLRNIHHCRHYHSTITHTGIAILIWLGILSSFLVHPSSNYLIIRFSRQPFSFKWLFLWVELFNWWQVH